MTPRHPRLAALTLLVVTLFACSGSKNEVPPATRKEVLTELGVNTGLGARATRGGAPMSDGDNPFGKAVVNLRRTAEVFIVASENTLTSGDDTVQLLDPLDTTPPTAVALPGTPTALTVSASGLSGESRMIKRPVAADLDGDGKDEVVMAVFEPTPKLIKVFQMDDGTTYSVVSGPAPITWKTAKTYSANSDFGVSGGAPYLGATRDWANTIDIAAGDLDGDGKAEVVVTNGTYDAGKTAEVSVYALGSSSLTRLLGGVVSATASSTSIRSAAVAVGDIDGDGRPEAVLAGIKSSGGSMSTLVLKFTVQNGVLLGSFMNLAWQGSLASDVQNLWFDHSAAQIQAARELDAAIPILAIANLDDGKQAGDPAGNGVNEIVAGDDVIYLKDAGKAAAAFAAFGGNGQGILRAALPIEYLPGSLGIWGDRYPDTAYFNQLKAGDINGDGKDELVLIDYMRNRLRQYYYESGTQSLKKGPNVTINGVACPYLVLADVDPADAGSPVLKYVGHALVFSDPFILAVISGPPYWDKNDSRGSPIQDTNNMQTTLGFSASASFGVGASVEIKLGAWAGETAKVPVVANGEETVKTGVTTTYSAEFEVEVAGGIETTFNVPAGVDKVLFASVPVDVYDYVSTTDATKHFFVREPRKSETNFVDVDFYNAHNGDYPDITPAIVMNHVIGNPYSYPKLTDAQGLFASIPAFSYVLTQLKDAVSGTIAIPSVPEGIGYQTYQYSASGSVASTFSCSLEFTSEQEASFIGLEGSSASMAFGLKVSSKLEAGTFVSGAVGGLSADYWTTGYRYDWGIFAYAQTPTAGNQYMVLNYWVEPK